MVLSIVPSVAVVQASINLLIVTICALYYLLFKPPLYLPRAKSPDSLKLVNHHGVKVYNPQGSCFALHNTPKDGVVVTNCEYMSKNWDCSERIKLGKGEKTVGQVMRE